MLRIRTIDGKAYRLQDSARFVEICDNGGNVAAVVFLRDDGSITLCRVGDEEFESYIQAYKISKSKLVSKNV